MMEQQQNNAQYEYTPLFYEYPVQVKFWDSAGSHYVGGIAVKDRIICGCCGAIMEIEEIIEDAKEDNIHFDDAIIEMDWIDLSNAIMGDSY